MGEEGAEAEAPGLIRIYVGGVGAAVTAADVEKTFSALGQVDGVELVRTKDRSFAFMDFRPNSDKALAKLFATYNGCTWKGGKLKVEKAKENYLNRLKQEWAEDAKLMSTTPVQPGIEKKSGNCRKAEISNKEDMRLQIFFPKLKKVKSLPFKGTGKHKYSFQRIEVPPRPVHFCDCDEHCRSTERASQQKLSSPQNKIYERERCSKSLDDLLVDDTMLDETEAAYATDADNLVTNIGVGGSDLTWDVMQLRGGQTLPMGQQLARYSKGQHLKDGNAQSKTISQKRQKSESSASEVCSNKKAHQIFLSKITDDEFTHILPSLEISQEVEMSAVVPPVESQTDASKSTVQSTKGQSWLQKSSWKDLVGEMSNHSFSISHVLPGVNAVASESPVCNDSVFNSAKIKKKTARSDGEGSKALQVKQNTIVTPTDVEIPEKGDGAWTNVEESMLIEAQRKDTLECKRCIPKVKIGEVCTFMRNADSEKEWAKAKAALSGHLKKKSNEIDASTRLKNTPTSKW